MAGTIKPGDYVLESLADLKWREVKRVENGVVYYERGGCAEEMILGWRPADGRVRQKVNGAWYLATIRG